MKVIFKVNSIACTVADGMVVPERLMESDRNVMHAFELPCVSCFNLEVNSSIVWII